MIEFIRGIRTPVSTVSIPVLGEDPVEQGRKLRVPVTDQIFDLCACLVQIHDEIPRCLDYPDRAGMRGSAEDTDPTGGVFDDGEDVLALPGQGDGLDEVDGQDGM